MHAEYTSNKYSLSNKLFVKSLSAKKTKINDYTNLSFFKLTSFC